MRSSGATADGNLGSAVLANSLTRARSRRTTAPWYSRSEIRVDLGFPTFEKAEASCFRREVGHPALKWCSAMDRYVLPKIGGIASPKMLPWPRALPHLKCSRGDYVEEHWDEQDEHDGARRTGGRAGTKVRGVTRAEKSRILDEFEAVTGFHRKRVMRVLRPGATRLRAEGKAGRRIYDDGCATRWWCSGRRADGEARPTARAPAKPKRDRRRPDPLVKVTEQHALAAYVDSGLHGEYMRTSDGHVPSRFPFHWRKRA